MNLLLDMISNPEQMTRMSTEQWDTAIRFARHAQLLGYTLLLIERNNYQVYVPDKVLQILQGSRAFNSFQRLLAIREMRNVAKIFKGKEIPLVLLKGAAYIEAKLSPYQGRKLSDVDLLVAKKDMQTAEEVFLSAGWRYGEVSDYDQHYYRDWMHEIPPLIHPEREVEIDLHHNLVPPVSRIKPDASLLMAKAIPIDNSFYYILEPRDLFLHSATHLFFNDELRGGLRDLVDMHELSAQFAQGKDFWPQLVARARELDLQRPLYYALTTLHRLLKTKIPDFVLQEISQDRPVWPADRAMRYLIDRLIAPANVEHMQAPMAEWLLFVRSHWIKMPPLMLFKHLSYKAWTNMKNGSKANEKQAV